MSNTLKVLSIEVNGEDGKEAEVIFDTTKDITFPTDEKLSIKIIHKCHSLAQAHRVELR